ncbi:MAG: trypsin-like peptidase domain-containing protein [Acidobacteriota bacterium]|nr:trypsin-like peptidase domain-containing protein [Acidobacteriota bacterium]
MFAGLPELARRLLPSSVQVGRGGSGVIWNSDGVIVTNAHVVRGPRVRVQLRDGRSLEGEVTARDPRRDLAALRVEARDLPAAAIGNSNGLRVGQIVAAVGNPLGVVGSVTAGIIHAAGESNWIQADVRLAPGNSGGMMTDTEGRVVGINTMIVSGIAFAIPSNAVAAFLKGGTSRRTIGITMHPTRAGLAILKVEPHGPADRAGMAVGDILLASPAELARVLTEADGAVTLEYLRGGKPQRITVMLDAIGATAA